MNHRKIGGCLAFFIFLAANAHSQQLETGNSSFFFEQFPSSSACNESSLNALFAASGEILLPLENAYSVRGRIISHVKTNPSAETINISLSGLPHTLFTLSRIRLENGLVSYTGHIICPESRDAIVLFRKDQKYYLIKTEQRLVLTE